MNRFRKILNRLLHPGTIAVIVSVPVAAALLIYTFLFDQETGPVAYLAYMISAYSLIIVCVQLIRTYKHVKSHVSASLHKNRHIHRYLSDVTVRTHISLYRSLGINLVYVVIKLISGICYRSVWFGTLAVYYSLLAVMRFLLLRHVNRNSFGKEPVSELKRYRLCGIMLMIMNLALAGVVILMLRKNEGFNYAGFLIYIMAMYAFYTIIAAITSAVKYRKYNSPVMSAAKIIQLAAALVSMLSLQTAMLTQFNTGRNPEAFRQIMIAVTGGTVCLMIFVLGVFMIVNATWKLKRYRYGNAENGLPSGSRNGETV